MEKYTEQEYLYIRGYLITDNRGERPFNVHSHWREFEFGTDSEFVIYFDPKNQIEYLCVDQIYILLMGTFMNTETGCMDKKVLINEMFGCLEYGEKEFFDYVNILGGRHIIVFSRNGETKLITDCTAMRSTYYYTREGTCYVSSHYNMIHDIVQTEEHPFYETYRKYKKTRYICVSLPGDMTPWQDIRLLIPNHYLVLKNNSIKRFFPLEPLPTIDVQKACDYIAQNIKIQYEEIVKHFDVIHSMTAGCDSRICLAAAKNVKDKVTLFTYHNENPKWTDTEQKDRELNYLFAKELARCEGMKHFEVLFKGPYPKDLMSIMDKNHYHPINRLIEQLKSKYNFGPNTVHLRSSLVESCRNTIHVLPNYYRTRIEKFALWAQYHGILNEALPYFEDYALRNDIDTFATMGGRDELIHYWENRWPTWMNASMVLEDDILCDTWMLFNVRKIMTIGLIMPDYWRNRNIIFREIIVRLWPSLLQYKLPNSEKMSYDLIDQEFHGCMNFKHCEQKSGSLHIQDRKVSSYFEMRDYGACFGFADSNLKRGDFCEISFNYDIEKDTPYYYEFNIFTVWQDFVPDNVVNYMIIIDGKTVYLESCNNFNDRVNQILYCFRATESKKQDIKIRLQAVRDCCSPVYNGVINIKSVTLRKEWVKKFSKTPYVTSTREHYLKMD